MIFVDTGAFVARYRESDEWHDLALKGWAELERSGRRYFTHSFCVAEAVNLVTRYGGAKSGIRFGQTLLASKITIFRGDGDDDLATLEIMSKYADQSIGFTDCACFLHMRRHRLITAFSFDRHFRTAGFRLWPTRK